LGDRPAAKVHGGGSECVNPQLGALTPTHVIERYGRWFAIGVFGLVGALFMISVPFVWIKSPMVTPLCGATSVPMLAFALFFCRGPVKFRRRAEYLFGG
jgi:hypothetical protein